MGAGFFRRGRSGFESEARVACADFIMQNMKMQCNVLSNAHSHGVKKLLFLGSTCIYPKNAPQPMREDALLTSELELYQRGICHCKDSRFEDV